MNQIIDILFRSVPSLYARWGVNKNFIFPLTAAYCLCILYIVNNVHVGR